MPETMPKNAAGHGLRRHRHRVRVVLPDAWAAEVTVVEVLPQILPVEDEEIAAHARKRFEKQGIKILTGAKVTKVVKAGGTRSPRRSRPATARARRSRPTS